MLNVLLAAAVLVGAAPLPPSTPAPVVAVSASDVNLGDADLKDMRGGFALPDGVTAPMALNSAISSQELSGSVSSNSVAAGAIDSGSISFDGRALSGYSGIGNFLLNTGVSSLLQGAVNVTVNLAPAAAGH